MRNVSRFSRFLVLETSSGIGAATRIETLTLIGLEGNFPGSCFKLETGSVDDTMYSAYRTSVVPFIITLNP